MGGGDPHRCRCCVGQQHPEWTVADTQEGGSEIEGRQWSGGFRHQLENLRGWRQPNRRPSRQGSRCGKLATDVAL